jgi:hypothetical protein
MLLNNLKAFIEIAFVAMVVDYFFHKQLKQPAGRSAAFVQVNCIGEKL